jgi:rod shape-determining protein MreD
MIPSWGAAARVGAIVFGAFLLQVSGLGELRLFGGSFDLIPLSVVAIAFYAGSVPGAMTGFAAGLLLGATMGQPLGASALILTALGYAVGRYRELRDPAHGLAPIAVTAASTLGYLIAEAGVSFMLGFEGAVSPLVIRETILTVLLNSLLALPVFWLVARILRAVLDSDPFNRRRRPRGPRDPGPIGLRGLEV